MSVVLLQAAVGGERVHAVQIVVSGQAVDVVGSWLITEKMIK